MQQAFPHIGELVRHSGTMLLIDRLVEASQTHAVSEVTISEHATFFRPGAGVPAYVGLEYLAQTIAAYDGELRRGSGEPPAIGFLLGTRRYKSTRHYFADGETLRVRVDLTFNENGMAAFDGVIRIGGEECVTATINVYRPEDGSFDMPGEAT
ncbi:Beta-hydroxyacyl-(acyl-carrier-protein) dehydratase FabA/FabZ [Parvibaculum lavamentivorans DS-1]|uniref:Beta-hydroxyacyl-(Acyl-carrier-protein) dehydratase FabA/FabZ n=1 Tax=Parvibaculum lavamentivorans (strain DS-1 / DSM 13023 / NCIMB 13966) TaxID=402881 RepID=A7HT86_PARL1|nr:beta-hydroxyacyl-ACP dehydratase [Parvibaculum lavamentivorans]ABS63119.1 Beta-hydroxyacyl-(acyl-carrier-protein) dehydratase FabA/FabZ [Parvibaculum lavamentivorans DS-1]